MIKSAFTTRGKVSDKPGFLVTAKFEEGKQGQLRIVHFEQLKLSKSRNKRVDAKTTGGTEWVGYQEPGDWSDEQRRVEPYNRSGWTSYIARNHSQMKAFSTADGSRFLSQQIEWSGTMSNSICGDFGETGVVVNTVADLSKYLDKLLPKIGVPAVNLEEIKAEILNHIK